MRQYEFNSIKISSDVGTGYLLYNTTDTANTEYQEDPYIYTDGSSVSNFHYGMRVVSVEGNIYAETKKELFALKQNLYRRCNGKTIDKLYYSDGYNRYFAYAFADIPTFGAFKGTTVSFTVNFNLYDFYWYMAQATILPVVSKKDYITSDGFSLPLVFTIYDSQQTVENTEEFDIYPVVRVLNNGKSAEANISVLNETTGESVSIKGYTLAENDILTFDCLRLTAVNSAGDNILNYCNEFETFCIARGDNLIKGYSNNDEAAVSVSIEYYAPRIGV